MSGLMKDEFLKMNEVCQFLVGFGGEETGQDAIEYALLVAFVALAGAAMFMGMSSSANTLWSVANNNLAAGNAGS
jgi:Flp pilus assembly pilin Flp